MSTIAIIPAKGMSDELPRKNLAILGDKPLIVHTIEDALNSELIDKVVVSTEDAEIGDVSKEAGAEVIFRPRWLCEPHSRAEEAIEHALYVLESQGKSFDIVALLQCTSPFRRPNDLDNAIKLFKEQAFNSLFSACEIKQFLWRKNALSQLIRIGDDMRVRPMRQDKSSVLIENGSFWITKTFVYKNFHNRLLDKVGKFGQPNWCGIEIDTMEDLELCRILLPWLTKSGLV